MREKKNKTYEELTEWIHDYNLESYIEFFVHLDDQIKKKKSHLKKLNTLISGKKKQVVFSGNKKKVQEEKELDKRREILINDISSLQESEKLSRKKAGKAHGYAKDVVGKFRKLQREERKISQRIEKLKSKYQHVRPKVFKLRNFRETVVEIACEDNDSLSNKMFEFDGYCWKFIRCYPDSNHPMWNQSHLVVP